jgi:FlaA1/EpsC-like NDP-sugar epimerase|tara:strand:+ start:1667 stop:2632 length:966 start_codon:yes stop_codon:yes gene_type:complete
MKNKTILITGGTGSLGKALVKQLKQYNKIIIYSRDEGKQALIFGNNPEIVRVIGDVRDYNKLNVTLQRHKVDYIIHTAALKRIDDMEWHPDECIKTNINGSENVARAALSNGVKKCILVSTDKACQPVNVYGSSKFIAERIFTNYDYYSTSTTFASVRYGNVIASRGSFVPLFMDWIKKGQKIKVTSEEMTRFLFTLNDAVDAVLGALENSQGGEVFVPQINSYTLPVCIEALEKIIDKKSNTEIVGLRPGEKLHEDMLAETELPFTYQVPNINLLQIRPQYTNRIYRDWEKYRGPHFNSELWVKEDIKELKVLIEKGLKC